MVISIGNSAVRHVVGTWRFFAIALVLLFTSVSVAVLQPRQAQALTFNEMQRCSELLDGEKVVVSTDRKTIVSATFKKEDYSLYFKCTNKSDPVLNCEEKQVRVILPDISIEYSCRPPTAADAQKYEIASTRSIYANALSDHYCGSLKAVGGSTYSACVSNILNAFYTCFDGYVNNNEDFVYPNYDINFIASCTAGKSGKRTAEIASVMNAQADKIKKANSDIQTELEQSAGQTEQETSCSIDNIGWLLCPVMNFSAKVVDYSYGWIENLLSVTPVTTTGGGTALYSAWTAVRNIANAAFVVMFLIIIYSQITGAGLTNYGIKKILPKLVVAAILVNASYWLCAIAVDISNILGNSLYTLFNGGAISKGIDLSQFDGDISSQGNGWTGLVAAVLGSAAVYVALPALLPALVGALVAIVTVFLVLTLRQVLIILLIVISPLAFVALLLPNTEEWFKRWRGLFQTLLLMYPIIAVIFGASKLASDIVTASATDVNGDGKLAIQIMGALITILPLALTPIIMKISGGVLNRFAGMVNNPNKGPFDKLRKKADSTGERMRNQRTASSIERGRKVGNWARKTRVGSRLGKSNSRVAARALNTVDFAASAGATGKVNAAERDKYAKVLADAGARNYTAKRALASEAYAADLAGGDAKTAVLVQSYAQKAVREEDRKDIEAIREKIGDTATTDFVKKMQSSSDGHEMAAYAAEIAKRGPGRQFHEALEASRYIVDDDHRRLVQSELINNMREDHLGVSDSMRGQLAVGDLKDDAVIKNDDGSERLNGKGQSFDKIYEASMDLRMEKKMSADYVVGMKPHDMSTAQEMMESGEISDGALQSMIDNMLAAESNDNTAVKIKDETKKMFDTARVAAQKRGLTAKMPTPQGASASTSGTSGSLVTSTGTPPPGNLPPGPGQPPTTPNP